MRMEQLVKKIWHRLSLHLYLVIPAKSSFRNWPSVNSYLLKRLEPLHFIDILHSDNFSSSPRRYLVCIDGFRIPCGNTPKTALRGVYEAIKKLYGDFVERQVLRDTTLGITTCVHIYENVEKPLWLLIYEHELFRIATVTKRVVLCAPCSVQRIGLRAVLNEETKTVEPAGLSSSTDALEAVFAIGSMELLSFAASKRFFISPSPENARCFGDLCLLAQASKDWSVTMPLMTKFKVQCHTLEKLDFALLARYLSMTPGFEQLLETVEVQPLLNTNFSRLWRILKEEFGGRNNAHTSSKRGKNMCGWTNHNKPVLNRNP